jgi:vancomycin resistance protein YoaR
MPASTSITLLRTALVIVAVAGAALSNAQNQDPQPQPSPSTPEPVPIAPPPAPRVSPLTLVLETSEAELRDGRIAQAPITRRFPLPEASVAVSRERQRLSNGLEEALIRLSKQLRRPAVDARWTRDDGGWVAKQQSAWTVDEELTTAYMLEALRYAKLEARIIVRRSPPPVTVQRLYDQGFRHHFGGGESSFAGSPSFRVQNIVAGAKQIEGRVLKRGEVFDFNRSVRVTTRGGFVPGYVIRGSLLEKDIGGGICQVSTTVWRAAYEAGLPILERHQHSYRVSYYDPPGMEATVYAPLKNLRFRNDSPGALLIQLEVDLKKGVLSMHFFGSKPDRRVSITQPRITNEIPAPRDRFVRDPKARLGDALLVSGAENGMRVSIERIVQYDAGRKARDVTASRYVPWGAIYGVHPRDPRVRR